MLQINMADVMNVIGSLTPYLIAIGVLFAIRFRSREAKDETRP